MEARLLVHLRTSRVVDLSAVDPALYIDIYESSFILFGKLGPS